MPNRCPRCEKFVPLELREAEAKSPPDVDEGGAVSVKVRVVRSCVRCGVEMRQVVFDLEDTSHESLAEAHVGSGHELHVDESEVKIESVEYPSEKFKRSYFGVSATVPVRCSCQDDGAEPLFVSRFDDKIQASRMDPLHVLQKARRQQVRNLNFGR